MGVEPVGNNIIGILCQSLYKSNKQNSVKPLLIKYPQPHPARSTNQVERHSASSRTHPHVLPSHPHLQPGRLHQRKRTRTRDYSAQGQPRIYHQTDLLPFLQSALLHSRTGTAQYNILHLDSMMFG